ncbi:hypothetical protein Q5752_001649 [Cryptotrichosporon argae]
MPAIHSKPARVRPGPLSRAPLVRAAARAPSTPRKPRAPKPADGGPRNAPAREADAFRPDGSPKRRRARTACDACRRIKKTCGGGEPCAHCAKDCTACTFSGVKIDRSPQRGRGSERSTPSTAAPPPTGARRFHTAPTPLTLPTPINAPPPLPAPLPAHALDQLNHGDGAPNCLGLVSLNIDLTKPNRVGGLNDAFFGPVDPFFDTANPFFVPKIPAIPAIPAVDTVSILDGAPAPVGLAPLLIDALAVSPPATDPFPPDNANVFSAIDVDVYPQVDANVFSPVDANASPPIDANVFPAVDANVVLPVDASVFPPVAANALPPVAEPVGVPALPFPALTPAELDARIAQLEAPVGGAAADVGVGQLALELGNGQVEAVHGELGDVALGHAAGGNGAGDVEDRDEAAVWRYVDFGQ